MGRCGCDAQARSDPAGMHNRAFRDAVATGRAFRPDPGVHAFAPAIHKVPRRTVRVRTIVNPTIQFAVPASGAACRSTAPPARRGHSPCRSEPYRPPVTPTASGADSVAGRKNVHGNRTSPPLAHLVIGPKMHSSRTDPGPSPALASRSCVEFALPSLAAAQMWPQRPLVLGRSGSAQHGGRRARRDAIYVVRPGAGQGKSSGKPLPRAVEIEVAPDSGNFWLIRRRRPMWGGAHGGMMSPCGARAAR